MPEVFGGWMGVRWVVGGYIAGDAVFDALVDSVKVFHRIN
jgi:hypothetical protein